MSYRWGNYTMAGKCIDCYAATVPVPRREPAECAGCSRPFWPRAPLPSVRGFHCRTGHYVRAHWWSRKRWVWTSVEQANTTQETVAEWAERMTADDAKTIDGIGEEMRDAEINGSSGR